MSIYGKLTDHNGENLAYQEVIIIVAEKTFTVSTTNDGDYKIQITPTTTGTESITATYKGTNIYTPSSTSCTFIVVE